MPILNTTYISEVVLHVFLLWSWKSVLVILSSPYQHKPSTVRSLILKKLKLCLLKKGLHTN